MADVQWSREMSTLGDRLKSARKERSISQAALARAVGARQGSINDIENGRIKSSSYLTKIATALNVDPLWLETGIGDIRGVGVEIVRQGAPLPLFDWSTVVDIALDDSFEKPFVDMVYRCPVQHSDEAFTVVLNQDRERLPEGTVLFVDPVGNFKNGDLVLVVFPDSRLADIRQLVSDGFSTFLKSLDPGMDAALRLAKARLTTMSSGELNMPNDESQNKQAIIVGRVFFSGYRYV